jgi:hypothetical protein
MYDTSKNIDHVLRVMEIPQFKTGHIPEMRIGVLLKYLEDEDKKTRVREKAEQLGFAIPARVDGWL